MPVACLILLTAAFAVIMCMLGGTRPIYSLPAYGLVALSALVTLVSFRRRLAVPSLVCVGSAVLCFGYLLIRAFASPYWFLAKTDIFSITACVTLYFIVACCLPRVAQRVYIVGVLFLIAAVEVGVGLIQFNKDPQFMLFGFKIVQTGHISGMFANHSHFAGYLEVVAVMMLSLAVWGRTKTWLRVLAGYFAVVGYTGIALSGSRGGYLSVLCSLAAFGLLSFISSAQSGRGKSIVATVGTVLAAGIGILIAVGLLSNSITLSKRLQGITADDIRTDLWVAGMEQFHISPAVGTGAGTYLYYSRLFVRPSVGADPVHAHNDYVELLAEYGVVGAVLMLCFIVAHVSRGVRDVISLNRKNLAAHEHGNNELALKMGVLSAIAAWLAHSFVDFNLHIPGNALLGAFLFAVLASSEAVREPATKLDRLAGWFRFAAPALGLWFLGWGAVQTVHLQRSGLPIFSALGAWNPAMILPTMASEYHAERARVAMRKGEFVSCVELVDQALRYEPNNPYLYFYLGEAHRGHANSVMNPSRRPIRDVRLRNAIQAYQRGLAIFPEDIHTRIRMAQCLDGLGDYLAAETAFQEAIKYAPNHPVIQEYYKRHQQTIPQDTSLPAATPKPPDEKVEKSHQEKAPPPPEGTDALVPLVPLVPLNPDPGNK